MENKKRLCHSEGAQATEESIIDCHFETISPSEREKFLTECSEVRNLREGKASEQMCSAVQSYKHPLPHSYDSFVVNDCALSKGEEDSSGSKMPFALRMTKDNPTPTLLGFCR